MEHFTKNLETLQKLLTESNGAFMHFGNEQYRFTQQATVTPEEIADFEAQHHIKLPETFKTFIITLGACTLFEDERGFAYQFFQLKYLKGLVKISSQKFY